MAFPVMDNSGTAQIKDGQVTFSYMDSWGRAQTETRPLLTPAQIVAMAHARDKRFEAVGEFCRESDESRTERKYIAAQPRLILLRAWALAKGEDRDELAMMLDGNSHHGISDPKWLKANAKAKQTVLADDGKTL